MFFSRTGPTLSPYVPDSNSQNHMNKMSYSLFVCIPHSPPHHGLFGVHLLRGRRGHFLDDWGDVGGPVQLNLRKAILVGLHYALDSCRDTRAQGYLLLFICFSLRTVLYIHGADLTVSVLLYVRK